MSTDYESTFQKDVTELVMRHIDRMNDVCEQDTADNIIASFIAQFDPLFDTYIAEKRSDKSSAEKAGGLSAQDFWTKNIEDLPGYELPLIGGEHSVKDYHYGPTGEGPMAYDWSDKPHRLVYDLCRALLAAHNRPTAVMAAVQAEPIREGMPPLPRAWPNSHPYSYTAGQMQDYAIEYARRTAMGAGGLSDTERLDFMIATAHYLTLNGTDWNDCGWFVWCPSNPNSLYTDNYATAREAIDAAKRATESKEDKS